MKIINIHRDDEDMREILTPDQWKIAEEAEAGNRHCMRGMAEIYENMWHRAQLPSDGIRTIAAKPEKLFRLAFRWRLRAAEAGDRESMRWLSVYMVKYAEEYRITEEMTGGVSALEWQKRAAEAGDRFAMKWMGDICSDPYYENFDQAEADRWYRESARAGCVYAMNELGVRYEEGIGCVADAREAARWYAQAAETLELWRDLSGTEIRMAMEDVVKASELFMKEETDEDQAAWILRHLQEALKLSEKIAVSQELMKSLRKCRLKAQTRL